MSTFAEAMAEVEAEALRAERRYGDMTSSHEGLGVLIEEMDELRAVIRTNAMDLIYSEAIQVAAVAVRLAAATSGESFRRRSGA